jgi:hypothetical protein
MIFNNEESKLQKIIKNIDDDEDIKKLKKYYLNSTTSIYLQLLKLKRNYSKKIEKYVVQYYKKNIKKLKNLNPFYYHYILKLVDSINKKEIINYFSDMSFEKSLSNLLDYTKKNNKTNSILQIYFIYDYQELSYEKLISDETYFGNHNIISLGKVNLSYYFYGIDNQKDLELHKDNNYYTFKKFNIRLDLGEILKKPLTEIALTRTKFV